MWSLGRYCMPIFSSAATFQKNNKIKQRRNRYIDHLKDIMWVRIFNSKDQILFIDTIEVIIIFNSTNYDLNTSEMSSSDNKDRPTSDTMLLTCRRISVLVSPLESFFIPRKTCTKGVKKLKQNCFKWKKQLLNFSLCSIKIKLTMQHW